MYHTVLQLCVNVYGVIDVRKNLMVGFMKVNVVVDKPCNWILISMKEKVLWTYFSLTCYVHITFSHILWNELVGSYRMNAILQNALIGIKDFPSNNYS